MKNILILAFAIVATNSYAQSQKDNANKPVAYPAKVENNNDSIIPVEYVHPSGDRHEPAYFVNGNFVPGQPLIAPDQIENIRIVKSDSIIDGMMYYGQVHLEMKNYKPRSYIPDFVTLRDLVNSYTTLKNKPVICTIDGRLINADYTRYSIDKNAILKIVVEQFKNTEDRNEWWLVEVLTKTDENIQKSKQIMLRGNSSVVGNY